MRTQSRMFDMSRSSLATSWLCAQNPSYCRMRFIKKSLVQYIFIKYIVFFTGFCVSKIRARDQNIVETGWMKKMVYGRWISEWAMKSPLVETNILDEGFLDKWFLGEGFSVFGFIKKRFMEDRLLDERWSSRLSVICECVCLDFYVKYNWVKVFKK